MYSLPGTLELIQFSVQFNSLSNEELISNWPELMSKDFDSRQAIDMYKRFAAEAVTVWQRYPQGDEPECNANQPHGAGCRPAGLRGLVAYKASASRRRTAIAAQASQSATTNSIYTVTRTS